MAESTLSLTFEDLARSTAFYLGWGRKADAAEGLTTAQVANVLAANNAGYRDFLGSSDWGFLTPRASFTLWATKTGTISTSGTTATATTAKFFASMLGHEILIESILNGTFAADTDWTKGAGWTIGTTGKATATGAISTDLSQTVLTSGITYRVTFTMTRTAGTLTATCGTQAGTARSTNGTFTEDIVANGTGFKFATSGFTGTVDTVKVEALFTITAYQSATIVTISASYTATSKAFTVTADGVYRLPDDFGSIDSERIYFAANNQDPRTIAFASEPLIVESWQLNTQTQRPALAAVRPLSNSAGTGQRFDLVVASIPDTDYPVSFDYNVHPNAITTTQYPYGGMKHAETIRLACLAKAEEMFNDHQQTQRTNYARALALSKQLDQRQSRAERLGISYEREYGGRNRSERYVRCVGGTVEGVAY